MFPLKDMAHFLVHHDGIVVDCNDSAWYAITGTESEPYDLAIAYIANSVIYRMPFDRANVYPRPDHALSAAILMREPALYYKNSVVINEFLIPDSEIVYY